MEAERTGAIWLASYPKSGNTWLRCLLEAYRRNGLIDLNDMRISCSDGGATVIQGVSPMVHTELGWTGELLLRPAALLNLFSRLNKPIVVKTHFANIQPDGGLPHCIPAQFTERAVYVVRDPRDVVLSAMRFFRFPLEYMVKTMNATDFRIGGDKNFATALVSSWSNHVLSWVSETRYPVHVVRYEDLLTNAAAELRDVLEFMGDENIDEDRVQIAVEASELANLKSKEEGNGFRENPSKDIFFGRGGSRWQDELGPRWVQQIENDHRTAMEALQYLESEGIKADAGENVATIHGNTFTGEGAV